MHPAASGALTTVDHVGWLGWVVSGRQCGGGLWILVGVVSGVRVIVRVYESGGSGGLSA